MAMNNRIYLTSFSSSLQGMVQTSLPLCPCFVRRFRLWGTILFLLILSSCNNEEEKNTASKYYPTKILSPDSRTVQGKYPIRHILLMAPAIFTFAYRIDRNINNRSRRVYGK